MISDELIRCAIVLAEIWNEAIEEASRIYFGQNDAKAMINYLAPYHRMMEAAPETMNEIAFYQGYASDLQEAEGWCRRFQATKNPCDINQAWDIYLGVFRRIQAKQKEV
jgi:FKBP12-rapamycin complex-associated protein